MASGEESTLRQRKAPPKTEESDTATPEVPTTPPKKKSQRKKRSSVDEEESSGLWVDACRVIVFLLLVSCGLSYLISNGDSFFWGLKNRPNYLKVSWWKLQINGPRYITLEELAQYDGTDLNKPIYLAIDGDVFDVTAGRHMYGPGGSYHWFAGVDATRAFVTGCFQDDRNGDLRGLEEMFLPLDNPDIDNRYWTPAELARKKEQELQDAHRHVKEAVDGWANFFRKSHKYSMVGKVVREPGWEGERKTLCMTAQKKRGPRKPPGTE